MTGKSANYEIQVNDLKTLQLPTNSLCLLFLNELNRDLFCHIKRTFFFNRTHIQRTPYIQRRLPSFTLLKVSVLTDKPVFSRHHCFIKVSPQLLVYVFLHKVWNIYPQLLSPRCFFIGDLRQDTESRTGQKIMGCPLGSTYFTAQFLKIDSHNLFQGYVPSSSWCQARKAHMRNTKANGKVPQDNEDDTRFSEKT